MRRDSPVKRRNPSGQVVWVARYTGRDGRRHIAKPSWNRGKEPSPASEKHRKRSTRPTASLAGRTPSATTPRRGPSGTRARNAPTLRTTTASAAWRT
jgi:hypothetical protein